MKFTKYEKYGDYHWRQYQEGHGYKAHADKIKEWVKEKNVLDVGAGDGLITHLLGAKGIDDEPSGVKLAQKRGVDVVLGDAYSLPNEKFDAITMIDVLEHLEFPNKALLEARRIAEYLYIATPVRGKRKGSFHYQEWTPEELKNLVEKNGFLLQEIEVVKPPANTIYAKFKRKDLTWRPAIIYYTSNQEDEDFENKIRENILNVCGDIPIVSVSQKPIDFGNNICVGDVGVNDDNLFRQVQMACQNTDTDYVITTEADVIYPEDYFKFMPPDLSQVYRSDNIWILYRRKERPGYHKKEYSEGGQIIGREFYLSILDKALEKLPKWNPLHYRNGTSLDKSASGPVNKIVNPFTFSRIGWQYFHSDPIISVKTDKGLRTWGGRWSERKEELPIWGHYESLKQKYGLV